jgi:DNA excision repair protein ERCC-3
MKQALVRAGYLAEGLCGYADGIPLSVALRLLGMGVHFCRDRITKQPWTPSINSGGPRGGACVVVLLCGAGKTVIGIVPMAKLQTSTLILATNTVAVHQWRDELLDKTDLSPEHIGEYAGDLKQIRPVTLAIC